MKLLNKNGFTLIELLIGVAIIGVLTTVGMTQYPGYLDGAKSDASEIEDNIKKLTMLMDDDRERLEPGVMCPPKGCKGPYSVYSSDPCQNPYEGGHSKALAAYFMNARCNAGRKGVTCKNPHKSRGSSWKGKMLKYGDRGPMQCN